METMKFNVPSIVCDGCAKAITEEIHIHESEAKVEVDVQAKTVTVNNTKASEASIRQMITALGHTVE